MIDSIKDRLIVRYIAVGITGYLFEIIIIQLALAAGLSAVMAVGISFWLGLIVSFILTKIVTFQDTRTHKKIIIAQLLGYTLLTLWNFAFTVGFTYLFQSHLSAIWCRTITLAITVTWNFFLYRTHIFQTKKGNV